MTTVTVCVTGLSVRLILCFRPMPSRGWLLGLEKRGGGQGWQIRNILRKSKMPNTEHFVRESGIQSDFFAPLIVVPRADSI